MGVIIDVVALVCADDVLAKYGTNNTQSSPTVLAEDYGGLIVAGAYGGGRALFGLRIVAPAGSEGSRPVVRWRARTLSMNSDYRCVIDAVSFDAGVDCMAAATQNSAPCNSYHTDLVDPGDASKLTAQPMIDQYWEAAVKGSGTAPYQIDVKIVDHHGATQGYYRIGSGATQPSVLIQ
ncbi:inclusion body family protein [Trinickia sp. LjRoot230]|uniref:AidA/PixA family protein n=1 Tax=Trinickia sp. LjRoot230 TaxID=3342288 RepID=UPI003ECEA794